MVRASAVTKTSPEDAHERIPNRFRQRVCYRDCARHLAGGAELAAARRAWSVRRAAVRYRIHRAAACQPAQLVVSHSAGGGAWGVPAVAARALPQPLRRRAAQPRPVALESAAGAV